MKSPSTRLSISAGAAVLALIGMMSMASLPIAASLVSAAAMIAFCGFVAFAAQLQRLNEERRLVYRPVHIHRQGVHKRIRSDDE